MGTPSLLVFRSFDTASLLLFRAFHTAQLKISTAPQILHFPPTDGRLGKQQYQKDPFSYEPYDTRAYGSRALTEHAPMGGSASDITDSPRRALLCSLGPDRP